MLKVKSPLKAPVKPRTARQVLLAAAKFIEEHGWSATGHEQACDRHCPVQAIWTVTSNDRLRWTAIDLLGDYIQHTEPTGIVTYWNSRSSEDEVVAAMREAAR